MPNLLQQQKHIYVVSNPVLAPQGKPVQQPFMVQSPNLIPQTPQVKVHYCQNNSRPVRQNLSLQDAAQNNLLNPHVQRNNSPMVHPPQGPTNLLIPFIPGNQNIPIQQNNQSQHSGRKKIFDEKLKKVGRPTVTIN